MSEALTNNLDAEEGEDPNEAEVPFRDANGNTTFEK